jgi:hypothetical protein
VATPSGSAAESAGAGSPLTAEQRRAELLAKLFDLRMFVGALFVIFGVLVTIAGIGASDAEIAKAEGIRLALWTGLTMLAVGLFFVVWVMLKPPEVLHGHEVTDDDLPEQMRGHGH